MARALTAPELVVYRTPNQATRVLFAIPTYHTIYTATLASVPSSNDMVGTLAFTNGAGTLSDVKADMTLYVGTSAGAYDLGMCRIRKAPIAGTFYVGEISEVEFDHGGTIYLTVVDDYSLWAKPVRLVSGVAKMDYDIDYSNQHTNFDPVPILGSHAVGKLVDGTVTLRLGPSADTASYVIGSSVSSYAWTCTGASFSSTTVANPNVTFTSPGTYLAYCTITGANGKTFQGVRYVIIYDDDNPLNEGVLRSVSYDHDSGGMSFSVEMYRDAAETDVRKRSLVILVTEDTVDNAAVEFACPIQGRENILAVGWVGPENITQHEYKGMVEFTCHNAAWWMQNMEGYLSGVEFKVGTSSDWTNCSTLTVRKMLFHFLHWRTTATRLMDVILTDDTKYSAGFKTVTGGLWEQITTIGATSIFAYPGVDRFNRLWIQVEPQMVAEASRTSFPEIMDMDSQDWVGEVHVLGELPRISMLYFSGVAVSSSATPLAYVSLSPGHIHGRYGRTEVQDNYLVSSQANSNQTAGLYYGWQNNKKEFEIELAASMRMTDIWPRQYVNLTITADEDPRGIGYDGRAILRRMEIKHDPGAGVLAFMHYYEPETFEGLAINGDIPDSEGYEDFGQIPNFPPLKPIPLTPITAPIIPEDVDDDVGPRVVLLPTSNFGLIYTVNGNEPIATDVDWAFMNSGLDDYQKNRIRRIIKTPSGALFALVKESAATEPRGCEYLFWTSGPGGEWTLLADATDFGAADLYGNGKIIALGKNPNVDEEIIVVGGVNGNKKIFMGDRNGISEVASGLDARDRIGDITYGMDKWFLTHSEDNLFTNSVWTRLNANGSIDVQKIAWLVSTTNDRDQPHIRVGGIVYVWNAPNPTLPKKAIDNDGNTAALLGSNVQGWYGDFANGQACVLAGSPDGSHLMGGSNAGVIGQRSTDYGATWGSVGIGLGIGYTKWAAAGSNNRFLAATTQSVMWTNDFGDTWHSLVGNLTSLASLCAPTGLYWYGD